VREKTRNLSELPTDPRKVIEHIRRYEFGIGASLEGDGLVVFENMRRRYQNLLATIAEDLNSKESHFLLELVQNADDNSYAKGVEPSLSFAVERDRLVVVNNEKGFLPKNVAALCSAGESSKKNKTGYIGEKGIGFKSVFKVTDAPEVHSNGYHFQFNRTDPEDLLGYVVPHWKDPDFAVDGAVTTFVLPTREAKPFPRELLKDIDATLLLFLEKLRRLEVNAANGIARYVREDHGPITRLTTFTIAPDGTTDQSQRRFFRTTKKCDMSLLREPKREGVEETELLLAFPVSAEGEAAPNPASPTYAFLPIRDFGFSFCIQADFVLISSREGLHEDLEWNVVLRDQIAKAFVDAVKAFKSHPRLANTYLSFLPDYNAVHDPFFRAVVEQINDALGEADCVPVEFGEWRKPENVIIVSDDIRTLLSSQDAFTLFGAEYPSANFQATQQQLERIGCRVLKTSDVINVFIEHADWLAGKSTEWKAKFFAYLASPTRREHCVKEMKAVPCLPVADGRFEVPQKGSVFYPLSKSKKYDFEHELTILDGHFYDAALAALPEVKMLFDELGVKQDNPYELITSHIFKRHAQRPIDSNRKALIGHVRYTRDKLDMYLNLAVLKGQAESVALNALRSGLLIGTKKEEGSWLFQPPSKLYLGKEYRPDFDIETLLGDNLELTQLVSDAYVHRKRSNAGSEIVERELESWRRFFYRIGVNESPLVDQTSSQASCSPELKALLESEDSNVRRTTLECLDRHWHKYDDSLTYNYVIRRSMYTADTPFKNVLRATKTPTRRRTVNTLPQAYLDIEDVKSILGGNVAFVDADIKNPKFLDAAGITYKVNATACIKRLGQIRESKGGATREQVRTIYRRLEILWSAEKATIENAFARDPLILVGIGESSEWVHPIDACWRATNVKFLDTKHPPLQSQYAEHHTFFTKQLAVPHELPLAKWIDALASLPDIYDKEERQSVALAIYRRLNRELVPPLKLVPSWLQRFTTESLFLDHRGVLSPRSDALYANDDAVYAALFEDEPTISLLAITPDHLPSVNNLLVQVGVQRISTALNVQPVDGVMGETNQILTQKVHNLLGCIARIVYTQSHERFETAIKDKLFEQLRSLEIQIVPSLELEVLLGQVTRRTTGDAAPKNSQLLLRAGAPSHVDHVAKEIRRILRLPQVQEAPLGILLRSVNLQDAEDYLQVSRVSHLPSEEQALLDGIDVNPPQVMEEAPGQYEAISTPINEAMTVIESASVESPEKTPSEPAPHTSPAKVTTPPRAMDLPHPSGTAPSPRQPPTALIPANAPLEAPVPQPVLPETTIDPEPMRTRAPTPVFPSTETHSPRTRRRHRHDKPSRSFKRTKTGRLLSYVEQPDDDTILDGEGERNPEVAKRKKAVELAAVGYFMATASSRWKEVQVMSNPNNPGFDIRAIAHDGAEEFIEVKGQSHAWTEIGVALTPTELLKASKERERYWLCVVEYATDEDHRQLYLVNNPFGMADQFRFDKGWKRKAITIAAKPTRPKTGLYVTIAGEGKARILEVRGHGQLMKLNLQFADGRKRFNKLFEPNTMVLSID